MVKIPESPNMISVARMIPPGSNKIPRFSLSHSSSTAPSYLFPAPRDPLRQQISAGSFFFQFHLQLGHLVLRKGNINRFLHLHRVRNKRGAHGRKPQGQMSADYVRAWEHKTFISSPLSLPPFLPKGFIVILLYGKNISPVSQG